MEVNEIHKKLPIIYWNSLSDSDRGARLFALRLTHIKNGLDYNMPMIVKIRMIYHLELDKIIKQN